MKKKTIALFLALALVVGCAIGGTVAWLTASTTPVVNTFTVGDINIELKETLKPDGTEETDGVTDWSAQIIPGNTYRKNPTVTVKANSVDCYLFVETRYGNSSDYSPWDYISFEDTLTAANGWTQGNGINLPLNVFYREVEASDVNQSWALLKNLGTETAPYEVSVNNTVTKTDIAKLYNEDGTANSITLTYTAYACQKDNRTVAQAWQTLVPGWAPPEG